MNFSFLYGTFPPALGVMSYASQYSVCPELVSAGIVLCTAVSAPLMFFSAQILNILQCSLEDDDLIKTIRTLDYNVAIASLIGICLTLSIFLASRRHLLAPHCFTSSILLHSLLAPLAAILLYFQLISCYWQVAQPLQVSSVNIDFTSESDSHLRSVLCTDQLGADGSQLDPHYKTPSYRKIHTASLHCLSTSNICLCHPPGQPQVCVVPHYFS